VNITNHFCKSNGGHMVTSTDRSPMHTEVSRIRLLTGFANPSVRTVQTQICFPNHWN